MTDLADELEQLARVLADGDRPCESDPALIRRAAEALRWANTELAHRRGRCKEHENDPGPSLYFDCCEVARLRESATQARLSRLGDLVFRFMADHDAPNGGSACVCDLCASGLDLLRESGDPRVKPAAWNKREEKP